MSREQGRKVKKLGVPRKVTFLLSCDSLGPAIFGGCRTWILILHSCKYLEVLLRYGWKGGNQPPAWGQARGRSAP